jgi:Zn-finger nucleic acid-binding protein
MAPEARAVENGRMNAPDIQLTRTTARCPRCERALDRLAGVAGVVAGCFGCGGAWLDNVAARELLHAPTPDAVRALLDMLPDGAAGAEQRQDYRQSARSGRKCPVCGEPLGARELPEYGVQVDLCEAHGTFFDPHELDPITRKIRPLSPEVEQALQAEADDISAAATQSWERSHAYRRHRHGYLGVLGLLEK